MQDNTYRSYEVTTPNAELPVTIDLARFQLRNEDLQYDDDYVRHLILTAADLVERTYGLALLNQTIKQYHATFPCSSDKPILLRIAPLYGVTPITSVAYVDSAGATQTWSSDEYTTGQYNGRPILIPKHGYSWPAATSANHQNAVTITYTAGYGIKASAIPKTIIQAMLLTITDHYENRSDSVRTMPTASDRIMQSFYRFAV